MKKREGVITEVDEPSRVVFVRFSENDDRTSEFRLSRGRFRLERPSVNQRITCHENGQLVFH